MTYARLIALLAAGSLLAACEGTGGDYTRDGGIDSKSLTDLKAGIWVDPNGCDHWMVEDGLEGYLTARLDPYGKPVCSGVAPPSHRTDYPDGKTS